MSLKHGLLGFLTHGPKSGYDLYKMFFKTVRPAPALIYRKLDEMEEDGLVTSKLVEQQKRPNRNEFHITEAGRKELIRWLKHPVKHKTLTDVVSIQLWYSSNVSKEDVISNLRERIRHLKKEREYYQGEATLLVDKGQAEAAKPIDKFYWQLVVDGAISLLSCQIKMAEEAIQKIRDYTEDKVESGSRTRGIKK
jgi:DNA-binding PadR family transcriptional regulator